ncbi:MAG TPA: DUF3501 family protein [Polyangiaceae bacterium]|nr:DUF3501 family protein [Polyangiaceae bacterium]
MASVKPITREELLDLAAYEKIRDAFLRSVIERKKPRYVKLGESMTALFENRDTVLLQIQEMLRTERITQEAAIAYELETYNALVPGERELSLTLFIEYQDRDERERMLAALAGLEDKFRLRVGSELLLVIPDARGTDRERTMAVHYLKFPLTETAFAAFMAGGAPVSLEVEHAAYSAVTELSAATLLSLRGDFS